MVDFSNLRSKGCKTDTVGVTSGVVSFISVYDTGIAPVMGEGKVYCILSVNHPEIENFLTTKFQNLLLGVILEDTFVDAVRRGDIVNYMLVDPFSKNKTWITMERLTSLLVIGNLIPFRREKEELKEMGKIELLNLKNRCPECNGQISLDNSTCLDCGYSSCRG